MTGSQPSHTPTAAHGTGTILEAAFVDPAYSWPPEEGVGKNAIELMASTNLLASVDPENKENLDYPQPPNVKNRRKVVTETEYVTSSRCGFLHCCKSDEAVVNTHTKRYPLDPEEKARLQAEYLDKKEEIRNLRKERGKKLKEKRREEFSKEKYSRVPEGVLIYRLDTSVRTIKLCSAPSSKTDLTTLLSEMFVVNAHPSTGKSRRGIWLIGGRGEKTELVACEQRTAIAWMEALKMMLKKSGKHSEEEEYLNLAAYSNNLIHTGAIPSHKKGNSGSSGIFYSVTKCQEDGEEIEIEALESISKRRAVIKDSWDFYRMVCSLLRDRRKYDEAFRRMQLDPVYPYLNSMTGLNDPGDDAHGNDHKDVIQKKLPEYQTMTRSAVCKDLTKKAEEALPSLVEICKALAGSLGMEEVGVGPLKEASAAIRKAEKKYDGDVLKVKDYCRALLVVKDFPTLLALLELARDSFGPLIRRVKLSTLKSDHDALAGGYRDCKINVELNNHICEIQLHVWPMWVHCGVEGFRHYRHCLEYSTDSFKDPYDSLANLDSKTLAELIVMSEEAVAGMPLDALEWYHEKYILDYFAEVGLFLDHGLVVWAETTLRSLIKLRCESPDIGVDHEETIYLQKYLERSLRLQNKFNEANGIAQRLKTIDNMKKSEKEEAVKSLWDSFCTDPTEAFSIIMDPNKKERDEETRLKKEIKASKKSWRKIREKKFKFLDNNDFSDAASQIPEQKHSTFSVGL